MKKIHLGFIACLVGAAPGLSLAVQPVDGAPGVPAGEALPAEVCTAYSVSKVYRRHDHDFERVRSELTALPEAWAALPGARVPKSASDPIPAAADRFAVRIEHAGCERVAGPLAVAAPRNTTDFRAKDCAEADCEDPAPGLGAPDGSVMVIWSCANGVVREVEYEKVDGMWKVKSSRQDRVVSCPLPKEPGGGEPGPEPDKD